MSALFANTMHYQAYPVNTNDYCCCLHGEQLWWTAMVNSYGHVGIVSLAPVSTLLLGWLRMKPLTSTGCTYFHQQLTNALHESAEGEKKVSGWTRYWTLDLWLFSPTDCWWTWPVLELEKIAIEMGAVSEYWWTFDASVQKLTRDDQKVLGLRYFQCICTCPSFYRNLKNFGQKVFFFCCCFFSTGPQTWKG